MEEISGNYCYNSLRSLFTINYTVYMCFLPIVNLDYLKSASKFTVSLFSTHDIIKRLQMEFKDTVSLLIQLSFGKNPMDYCFCNRYIMLFGCSQQNRRQHSGSAGCT